MSYWLLKTEPEEFSWERLESEKKAQWTGVRNFEARNNIRKMTLGDFAFIFHTGQDRILMGIAKITSEPYIDPTAEKGDWAAIDLEAVKPLTRPVSLEEIRNTYTLNTMPLISRERLSVSPVTDAQAALLLKIAKTEI
ncbi:MAG: EVE domain-containing protein [Patescibacteria group bacterium]